MLLSLIPDHHLQIKVTVGAHKDVRQRSGEGYHESLFVELQINGLQK